MISLPSAENTRGNRGRVNAAFGGQRPTRGRVALTVKSETRQEKTKQDAARGLHGAGDARPGASEVSPLLYQSRPRRDAPTYILCAPVKHVYLALRLAEKLIIAALTLNRQRVVELLLQPDG